jgi:hypothetical protein
VETDGVSLWPDQALPKSSCQATVNRQATIPESAANLREDAPNLAKTGCEVALSGCPQMNNFNISHSSVGRDDKKPSEIVEPPNAWIRTRGR